MMIIVTGGGSGGHITPLLAVAHELKRERPNVEIVYLGQRGDSLGDIPAADASIDRSFMVRAGKLRRYHGEGLKQLLDLKTVMLNLRDTVWVVVGLWQSFWLLKRLKPDVIFVKGGFVGVPVGLAAAVLRIPYITHDSDALPGLANRIIAPWAKMHAVALPKEIYTYPADRMETVGVPVSHEYHVTDPHDVPALRERLGLGKYSQVVLLTGGGNGAQRINDAFAECVPELLDRYPDLAVVQLAGRAHEDALRKIYKNNLTPTNFRRVVVKGFVSNLYDYSAVADVVITRAGGSSMAEFAAQAKACIVVPSPFLPGGHQLVNAKVLADRKTIKVVDELTWLDDHRAIMPALVELLDNPKQAAELGNRLAKMSQSDASHRLAMLLLDVAQDRRVGA